MNSRAHRNCSNSRPLESLEAEWGKGASELLPHQEGIRFVRGSVWGIALCMPVWIWILWAFAHHPW